MRAELSLIETTSSWAAVAKFINANGARFKWPPRIEVETPDTVCANGVPVSRRYTVTLTGEPA